MYFIDLKVVKVEKVSDIRGFTVPVKSFLEIICSDQTHCILETSYLNILHEFLNIIFKWTLLTIQYFVKADAVKRSGEPAATHSRNPAQVKQIYLNDRY